MTTEQNAAKEIYLVRRNGVLDYTITPAGAGALNKQTIIPRGAKYEDGSKMDESIRVERNAKFDAIGKTVTLTEHHIKVSASEVEIVSGPHALEKLDGGRNLIVDGKEIEWKKTDANWNYCVGGKPFHCLSLAVEAALAA